MIQTVEAVIDERGRMCLLEDIHLSGSHRALVTILEEKPTISVSETALLSEASLAKDWRRPEEEEAWSHLRLEVVLDNDNSMKEEALCLKR